MMPSMELFTAASLYTERGFSIIPCDGKRPALARWQQYQHEAADIETVSRWHKEGILRNIGLICGAVSGNLVVIDLDGEEAVQRWRDAFPNHLNTFTVRSGSGVGQHLYYKVDHLPPTTRMTGEGANFELRANGCYVIAPPSLHPITTEPYIAIDKRPIKRLPDMKAEVNWIKSLIKEKHGGVMPRLHLNSKPRSVTRYWAAALSAEAKNVQHAPKSSRNLTLYRAALKMGSVVSDGYLDQGDVEAALYAAAQWNGLVNDDGEWQTRATIRSGITNGLKSSRKDHSTGDFA